MRAILSSRCQSLLRLSFLAVPAVFFSGCFSMVNWAPEGHQNHTIFEPETVYLSEERDTLAYKSEITTERSGYLIANRTRSEVEEGYVLISPQTAAMEENGDRFEIDEDDPDPNELLARLERAVRSDGFTVVPELPDGYRLICIFESGERIAVPADEVIRYPVVDKLSRTPIALLTDILSLPLQVFYFPAVAHTVWDTYSHPGRFRPGLGWAYLEEW